MFFAKRSGAKNVRRKALGESDEDGGEEDAGSDARPTAPAANKKPIRAEAPKPTKVAKLSFDEEATEVTSCLIGAAQSCDALALPSQDVDSAFVVKKKSAVDGIPQACASFDPSSITWPSWRAVPGC
jgi:hypothetical protein